MYVLVFLFTKCSIACCPYFANNQKWRLEKSKHKQKNPVCAFHWWIYRCNS